MNGVAIVTVLALLEYFYFGVLVGNARSKYKVAAPAITGDPVFERYYRVHQNTLEQLIIFVPTIWFFGMFMSANIAVALGLLFIIARVIYARGYIAAPEKRAVGAAMTFGINGILAVGAIVGAILHSR